MIEDVLLVILIHQTWGAAPLINSNSPSLSSLAGSGRITDINCWMNTRVVQISQLEVAAITGVLYICNYLRLRTNIGLRLELVEDAYIIIIVDQ